MAGADSATQPLVDTDTSSSVQAAAAIAVEPSEGDNMSDSATKTPSDEDLRMTHLYYERQMSHYCAVHMINNGMQGPRFNFTSLNEIAMEFEKDDKIMHHDDDGNFSDEVVSAALAAVETTLVTVSKEMLVDLAQKETPLQDVTRAVFFHSQRWNHWWCYKCDCNARGWYNLGSTKRGPERICVDVISHLTDLISDDVTICWACADKIFIYQGWSVDCLQENQGWCSLLQWIEFVVKEAARRELEDANDMKRSTGIANSLEHIDSTDGKDKSNTSGRHSRRRAKPNTGAMDDESAQTKRPAADDLKQDARDGD